MLLTPLETQYTGDRIVIVAFRVREHCRDVHGMLKIQDPRIELILQSDPECIVFPQTQTRESREFVRVRKVVGNRLHLQ